MQKNNTVVNTILAIINAELSVSAKTNTNRLASGRISEDTHKEVLYSLHGLKTAILEELGKKFEGEVVLTPENYIPMSDEELSEYISNYLYLRSGQLSSMEARLIFKEIKKYRGLISEKELITINVLEPQIELGYLVDLYRKEYFETVFDNLGSIAKVSAEEFIETVKVCMDDVVEVVLDQLSGPDRTVNSWILEYHKEFVKGL